MKAAASVDVARGELVEAELTRLVEKRASASNGHQMKCRTAWPHELTLNMRHSRCGFRIIPRILPSTRVLSDVFSSRKKAEAPSRTPARLLVHFLFGDGETDHDADRGTPLVA